MRRQYGRLPATQFTVPRVQNRRPVQRRGRGRSDRDTLVDAVDMTIGGSLAERPVNIRREVEQKRRELQEKYNQEAAEAEQKRLRREQKKREEWLKRQESLVRPGYRLGCGKPSSNLQRDLEEHQNAIGIEPQEDNPHQQQTDQQLRMLLQQRADRDIEREQLDPEIVRQIQEAYIQHKKEEEIEKLKRRFLDSLRSRSRNTPKDLTPSTSNAVSPSTSKAGDFENPNKPANFSGVDQHAFPSTSNTGGSANTRKPANFLGVAKIASSSASNTNGPANTKTPANFLGDTRRTSPGTSIINVNPANPKKRANFLGAVQIATPSTANTNESLGQTEVDYRERMRAARLRMQVQYNEEVKKAEQAKDQEEHNLAEDVGKLSLK